MIFNNALELENNFSDYSNFPIIIYGSGPAGITLALELEKKNINSIIVEAGSRDYNEISQSFYEISTKGSPLTNIENSRLRQFGGTSSIWGGWCKPLTNFDFKKFGLNYKKLENYQEEVCKILDIKNSFRESFINKEFKQVEFQYSNVRFNEKYYNKILNSKKIILVLNTQLSHFEGKNGKIENSVCISEGLTLKLKGKEFILCCGGIENSRILMWSREKSKSLFHQNLKIGQYWMTHYWIQAGLGFLNLKNFKLHMKENFIDHDGPIHITSRSQSSLNSLQSSIYLSADDDQNFLRETIKNLLCIAPEYGKKIARLILNKSLKCGNIFMHIEEDPIEENRIILDKFKKDKNEIPLAVIKYKSSLKSKINSKSLIENLANYFRKKDLGRIAISKEVISLEEFHNLGNYHHLGGTRIGDSVNNSVVDKNLKVHNISNLFISGSSVFNYGTYKNPTFSIIQLSIMISEKLKKKLT